MLKKIFLGTLAGITLIGVAGALYVYSAINKDIDEHFAGVCTDLPLEGSGEDIQLDRDRGLAFLSVFDRKAVASGETPGPGDIMVVDLNSNPPAVRSALVSRPEHMHPHGISMFIDADGQRSLIMINHPEDRENGQETIERFVEVSPGQYRYTEGLQSPLITRANDLVAVGPRQFYVAQDTGQGTGQTVTDLVYFDGEDFSVVANDIESGGGINVSADNTTLYIAETNAKAIRVAALNSDDGSITQLKRIELDSSPDNINVAADGALIVGAHSNLIALVMHFIAGSDAPTQVLRVEPNEDPAIIEEIYLNRGTEISAGSGAVSYGNKLLIGSITDKKILICESE
ncbi:MAG: SMP-30/gluconolactonase/LRE family protein [Gammaproteobacteria bacterium]|jgi:arylesterase/paraoxonase